MARLPKLRSVDGFADGIGCDRSIHCRILTKKIGLTSFPHFDSPAEDNADDFNEICQSHRTDR